jgi:DUF4097 and DUF4098 domain-containing protein YvlB
MNENENNLGKCTRCGATLPANAPEGLCPRCVVAMNLSAETDIQTGEVGPGGTVVMKPAPAPPPPPEEIAKLFPQLEILESLGRGGMGAVYKARQPRLDRLVALKIISPEKKGDPQFAERFEREARTLARLHHPNIVAIYDFGEVQGNFYLLMEFVDGLTLRQLLQARKLSPEESLAIVPKICEALQYAHQQGIIHRDIKPENILLDKQGQVKIADFGIAKIVGQPALSALTGEQQIIGTPHYMAPEQVERPQTVDHRADIYSLGVVLYEMLTGELPLGKFAPPSQKVHVDVRLDEVVLHALEKEPELRYQQASQVKTDVETISESTKPSQPPVGLASPAPAFAAQSGSDKTILPALLLAFPFGIFGAHRFYVGKIQSAVLQLAAVGWCILLIIACATTGGRWQPTLGILLGFSVVGCVIIPIIDWILILCKAFTDGQGRRITEWVHPKTNKPNSTSGMHASMQAGTPPVFSPAPVNSPGPSQGATTPGGFGEGPASAAKPPVPGTGKITAPAVGLMVGGLWKLLSAFSALFFLTGLGSGWMDKFVGMGNFFGDWGSVAIFSLVIFKVVPALLIMFGAFQMMRLRSYAWAMAAGIISIVSCSLIGFPMGIWALIVLMQQGVRETFANAPGPSFRKTSAWPWVFGTAAAAVVVLAMGASLVLAWSYTNHRAHSDAASISDDNNAAADDLAPAVQVADNHVGGESDALPGIGETNSTTGTNAIKRMVQSGNEADFSKSFSVAPGGKLTMKVDHGDVRVTGSDENAVEVRVTREVTRASASEAAKIIKEHRIELLQNGNEISITAHAPPSLRGTSWFSFFTQPNLNVHYEISVPRKCDVQLKTAGGNIEVADLRGGLKAETQDGNLDLSGIEGKVDGQTMGGNIRAVECKSELVVHTQGGNVKIEEFSGPRVQGSTSGGTVFADFAVAPKADCDLHTSGGTVTAKLPADAAITLDAHTMGGTVNTELPVQTEGKHQGSTLRGTINGGGPVLKLETMGGNIDVLKR